MKCFLKVLYMCLAYAREVNPDIAILLVSATRGDGMAHWLNWLESERCA
ncbi:hydrogenase isoenzyme nickel incorporation hypB domain protein [Enterobacter cloacae]|nr:hydrogenase isoenzyme nickel incorporation hypB domain protein [Enterobacter cloacae]